MPSVSKADKENSGTKKGKRSEDRAYHPQRNRALRKSTKLTDVTNVQHARFAHGNKFTDANGKLVELKHCVVIDCDLATQNNLSIEKFRANFVAGLTQAATYRPLEKITEYSVTGSPIKGETPGKTRVVRAFRFGTYFSILSNNPDFTPISEQKLITTIANDHNFFNSPVYAALKEVHALTKNQTVLVTETLLAKSKKAHVDGGATRPISQDRAVTKQGFPASAGAAKKFIASINLFSDETKWEWLHLIAYRVWHLKAQTDENLVAGTAPANTCMMGIEAELQYLAEQFPLGFTLNISAHVIASADHTKKTPLGYKIIYEIITPFFTFPLEFNPQEPNTPHVDFTIFFQALVRALVKTAKEARASATMPNWKALTSEAVELPMFKRKIPLPASPAHEQQTKKLKSQLKK